MAYASDHGATATLATGAVSKLCRPLTLLPVHTALTNRGRLAWLPCIAWPVVYLDHVEQRGGGKPAAADRATSGLLDQIGTAVATIVFLGHGVTDIYNETARTLVYL
jgi:hypothetical protein